MKQLTLKRLCAIWALSVFLLTSCSTIEGNGVLMEDVRQLVADFDELQVESNMMVYVDYSPDAYVRIVAESNLLPNIVTHLSHNRLTVRKKGRIQSSFPIEVYVYSPEYSHIEKSGSGDMVLRDVRSHSLYIDLNGSGNTWIMGPEVGSKNEATFRMASASYKSEPIDSDGSDLMMPSAQRLSQQKSRETNQSAPEQALEGWSITNEYLNIALHGSGTVKTSCPVSSDEFEINVKGSGSASLDVYSSKAYAILEGSGKINMQLEAKMLIASVYGSGKMAFSGDLSTLDLLVKGSGTFAGYNLFCRVGIVEVEGSGDAYIHVDDVLYARGAGTGHICYQGYPVISADLGVRLRDKNE